MNTLCCCTFTFNYSNYFTFYSNKNFFFYCIVRLIPIILFIYLFFVLFRHSIFQMNLLSRIITNNPHWNIWLYILKLVRLLEKIIVACFPWNVWYNFVLLHVFHLFFYIENCRWPLCAEFVLTTSQFVNTFRNALTQTARFQSIIHCLWL